jgi:hypothetical protein
VADQEKRKISAKEILADLRSGMNESEVRSKYELSEKSLEKVYNKLIDAGLLDETGKTKVPPQVKTRAVKQDSPKSCPACNAELPENAEECHVCGLVLKKYGRREEYLNKALFPQEDSAEGKPWSLVVGSIAIFLVVGVVFIWWASHRGAPKTQISKFKVSKSVERPPDNAAPESVSEDYSADQPQQNPYADPFPNLKPPPEPAGRSTPGASEEKPKPPSGKKYETGVLRQFTSGDFEAEVVEASKTYPVLFQFYSDT